MEDDARPQFANERRDRARFRELSEAPARSSGVRMLELVVVVGIILVVAALFVPTICAARPSSRKTDCKNNLKQIGIYMSLYESKYKKYPQPGTDTWLGGLWSPGEFAGDGRLFRCALRKIPEVGQCRTDYTCIVPRGRWMTPENIPWTVFGNLDDSTPPDLPVCSDRLSVDPNHGAENDANILFFQGRVESFKVHDRTYRAADAFLRPSTWAAPPSVK